MPPVKGKCTFLNLATKLAIIGELKSGASLSNLSKKYGVAPSTIVNIKRNSTAISKHMAGLFKATTTKKTLRKSETPKMERALFKWFLKQRDRNVPIN